MESMKGELALARQEIRELREFVSDLKLIRATISKDGKVKIFYTNKAGSDVDTLLRSLKRQGILKVLGRWRSVTPQNIFFLYFNKSFYFRETRVQCYSEIETTSKRNIDIADSNAMPKSEATFIMGDKTKIDRDGIYLDGPFKPF